MKRHPHLLHGSSFFLNPSVLPTLLLNSFSVCLRWRCDRGQWKFLSFTYLETILSVSNRFLPWQSLQSQRWVFSFYSFHFQWCVFVFFCTPNSFEVFKVVWNVCLFVFKLYLDNRNSFSAKYMLLLCVATRGRQSVSYRVASPSL